MTCLLLAAGCDAAKETHKSTEPSPAPVASPGKRATADPDSSPPKSGGQDYDKYVEKLKDDTPIEVEAFQKAKMKAQEYEKNERYPEMFKFVVISVPRVYLTDKTTGKGQWYTRARLTLNNPVARKGTVPEIFQWARVEMLP